MFRKQVNPKIAGIAILIALGGIQAVYWFKLVYSPQPQGERRGGGGPVTVADVAFGRRDVRVETVAGDGVPGYEDGPGWRARFCGPNALALAPDDLSPHAVVGGGEVTECARSTPDLRGGVETPRRGVSNEI